MTAIGTDRMYDLLPVVHRLRDIDEGRPLQNLLRALGEQAEIVEQHIDRLWDDFFIETCDDWVIPYIGDLVDNDLLHDTGARRRVDVARTIYYRRRKGTVPMLEELARDVTGWGAHVVEFFELLGWTQHLDHLRFQAGWPDIRDIDRMDRVDGPFDDVSHTVDIRPDGRYAITSIGFFLYRLRSYPHLGTVVTDGGGAEHAIRHQPRPAAAPHLFHVSSLGAPGPLFNRWRREGDEAGLATESHVPGPIRPIAFFRDLAVIDAQPPGSPVYYGAAGLAGSRLDDCDLSTPAGPSGGALSVFVDGLEVPVERILCKNLSTWEAPPPGSDTVAVDVHLGRLAFAPDADVDDVTVEYHSGFSGDVGGGPYDRRRPDDDGMTRWWGPDTIVAPDALGPPPLTVGAVAADHTTISDAIDEWQLGGGVTPVVIQIVDDRTYVEDLTVDLGAASLVVVQAANGRRPTLVGDVTVAGVNQAAVLRLDGLVVEGRVLVEGDVGRVVVRHCTLVPGLALDLDGDPVSPGEPSLLVDPAGGVELDQLSLEIDVVSSIVGAIRVPRECELVTVRSSIVDGRDVAAFARTGTDDETAGPIELVESTVFGAVLARRMPYASDVIFRDEVRVDRVQEGCVRFSYVPPGSVTPRRHACQPDLALGVDGLTAAERARIEARIRPSFTSVHFHDPGYTQLGHHCPVEIREGASSGAEIGVWAPLRNPQREANLRLRLAEYLPFGLDPILIYVT